MACRNALASFLSGLRSQNSPCRWAARRHILRPKLLSGLESLTTSPTHSMVSHPTPTPSLPPPSPPSIPGVRGTAGCAMTLSSPAVACLPPPLPFPREAVRLRSFVVVFSLLACSLVHGEYRTSGTRARLSAWRRAERAQGRARVFRFLGRSGPAGQLHRRPVAGGAAGRVRRGRGARARAPSPAACLPPPLLSC